MSHNGCTPPAVSSGIWRRGSQASEESSTHSWLPAAVVILLPGTPSSSPHEGEAELLCQPGCPWLIPPCHLWVSFVSCLEQYRSRKNKIFVMGKQLTLLLLNTQWGAAPGTKHWESWGQPDWVDQRRQEYKSLLSFRVERKVTPVVDTYWGYLDPILCCVSGFQIALVVNWLSTLHLKGCMQKACRPCRVGACICQVLRSDLMLLSQVMNIQSPTAQTGGVFCLNWKAAAEAKEFDGQPPSNFSLNITLLFWLSLCPSLSWLSFSAERFKLGEYPREEVLLVLRLLFGWWGQGTRGCMMIWAGQWFFPSVCTGEVAPWILCSVLDLPTTRKMFRCPVMSREGQ